jgi:hypothetical protein
MVMSRCTQLVAIVALLRFCAAEVAGCGRTRAEIGLTGVSCVNKFSYPNKFLGQVWHI